MTHYTLNTGSAVDSPRTAVDTLVVGALRGLVDEGGPIPTNLPFRVKVFHGPGSALFTVWRGAEPLVTCGLAWTGEGEREAWPAIEKLYFDLTDKSPNLLGPAKAAEKPASLPWLAAVLLPSLRNQRLEDLAWLGDFEPCMAWAILDQRE